MRVLLFVSLLSVVFSGCLSATGGDDSLDPKGGPTGADAGPETCQTVNGLEYRCDTKPRGECFRNVNGQKHDCLMERFVEVTLIDGPFEITPDAGSSYGVDVPSHVIRGKWTLAMDVGAVRGLAASGACAAALPTSSGVIMHNLNHVQVQDVVVSSGSSVVFGCADIAEGDQTFVLGGDGHARGHATLTGLRVELVDPSWAPSG